MLRCGGNSGLLRNFVDLMSCRPKLKLSKTFSTTWDVCEIDRALIPNVRCISIPGTDSHAVVRFVGHALSSSRPATGELLFGEKGDEVRADFGNYALCGQNINTVNLCPIDSRNAVQLRTQIETGRVLAALS